MENFHLTTSQNVSLEYKIASVADRMLAYMLDITFHIVTALVFVFIVTILKLEYAYWMWVLFLPLFFYHFLFEIFFNGQSLGKMIMRIRVVKTDGSPLTLGSCFIRWSFRLIDITLVGGSLAVLTIIINGKGQRLGDIAASTTLLKTSNQGSLENTIWTEVKENYEICFPQVERLSEKDIQTIKDVLLVTRKQGRNLTTANLRKTVRRAIFEKTGISSELNDRDFLGTILKDYNALHQLTMSEATRYNQL